MVSYCSTGLKKVGGCDPIQLLPSFPSGQVCAICLMKRPSSAPSPGCTAEHDCRAVISVVTGGVIITSSVSQQRRACYRLGTLLNSLLMFSLPGSSRNPPPRLLLPDALFRREHGCSEKGKTLLQGHTEPPCQAGDSLPAVFSTSPAWMRLRKAAASAGLGRELLLLRGLPPAWASVSHSSAYYLA